MTMHMVGPWLSTTGKRKGKAKFRNADVARESRDSKERWAEIKRTHGVADEKKRIKGLAAKTWMPPPLNYRGATDPRIPSLDTGAGTASAAATKVYTGTACIGIATLHKSNAVPVFSQQDAIDISKMRRG